MALALRWTCDVMRVWIYIVLLLLDVTFSLKNARRDRYRMNPEDVEIQISRERKSSQEAKRKLVVTTVLDAPYMMMKPYSIGSFLAGNDLFEGYMADIVRNLSQSIGFDYVIKLAMDGKYGEPDLNSNWNGMIGELLSGKADMAVGPITITPERAEVIAFTEPFMTFRSTVLLKKPRKRSRKRYRIETPEDLLHSDVSYGVVDGSILQRVLRTSEEPLLRGMWARMQNFWPTAFVQNVQEGIERARREDYGFIVDTPLAEYLIGQQPCDLYAVEPFLSTRRYAMALRRGDALLDEVNLQLRLMHERQVMSEFYLKWWRSSCDLYVPRDEAPADQNPAPTTKSADPRGQLGHVRSRASGCRSTRGLVVVVAFVSCFCSLLVSSCLHQSGRALAFDT